jgi:NTE family protein
VSRVGLVLGGGGITGAAFHFGVLLTLRLATGWDPNRAEVVIGTSSGAFVAAMVRGDRLDLDAFIGDGHDWHDVADRLRRYVYRRGRPRGVARWVRRGVLPGLRRPDLTLSLGSPALYRTDGMVEWMSDAIGPLADTWPDRPTVIVGYDLEHRRRAPFGTEAAPAVTLKEAVGASVAVPFLFEPVQIRDRWYADGGIASGTSADFLLGNPDPLDLVIVVAPLAAVEARDGARFYEAMFDRAGRLALAAELEEVHRSWPGTDVLVLRPDSRVLDAARPNPMAVEAAVPVFLRTLRSMKDELAHHETWALLERHLVSPVASSQ